jgi:FkbM family methyltransferase
VIRKKIGSKRRIARIDDFDGDLTMHLDLSEHMQGQIFWHGSYSAEIIPLMKRILQPGSVVIDCGANVGEITLIAAKLVGERGAVYSIEPVSALADQLDRHVRENGFENVEVIRVGVGRASGTAPFFTTSERFRDGSHHDGLGTLFPTEMRSTLVGEIPLMALNDFVRDRDLRKIDLIKIDIEGGELAALQGATEVLATLRPALIVELGAETCRAAGYSMDDVYKLLRECGYEIRRIRRKGATKAIRKSDLKGFQNLYCVPST